MSESQARRLVDGIVSRLYAKPPNRWKVWWWRSLALIVWVTVLTGAVWLAMRTVPPNWIIARWQVDFTQVELDTARYRLTVAPSLGEPGARFLVASLLDPRPGVRDTAKRVLENEIQRWRSLPLPDASRRLAWVTSELVKVAEQLPADQHSAVQSWLTDWLTWPLDAKSVDTLEVLENCERSLAALDRAQRRQAIASAKHDQEAPDRPADSSTQHPSAIGNAPENAATADTPAAVGSTQWSLGDEDGSLEFMTGQPLAPAGSEEEHVLLLGPLPERTFEAADAGHSGSFADRLPQHDAFRANPQEYRSLQSGTPDTSGLPDEIWSASDIELARQLSSGQARKAIAAAEELRKRGYSGRAIAVLERLFDPDPSQRLAAVDMLPSVRELEAVVWLERMLDDPHAAVRQRVVAILGSQPTPRVRQTLARRRDTEEDPAIRAMLERILR
ncbi:MAG: hypothetical protein KatS3mg109_1793 [Pirellulaceae bacterium]|nr:MAG: hypothetical protein KatS3mg109_1793 [Pirellulaceae bacterium]